MPKCDYPDCGEKGEVISRLSPEGFLVATGKKAYSFREAYRRFYYCKRCHDELMTMFGLECVNLMIKGMIILLQQWSKNKSYYG